MITLLHIVAALAIVGFFILLFYFFIGIFDDDNWPSGPTL